MSVATSPFHAGELAVQEGAGTRAQAEGFSRGIRDYMPDPYREFFARLPFIVLASVDDEGQPWATLVAGTPGFVVSPSSRSLRIGALPPPDDPVAALLALGRPVGLLGIEQHSGRRNRANGVVTIVGKRGFDIEIRQSFGNCAKYIRRRQASYAERTHATAVELLPELDDEARRLIATADTFFIASAHPSARAGSAADEGVDVSHRGGEAGFVGMDAAGSLLVTDLPGNGFFNTFGNLLLSPRAGLLFVDFARGTTLQLAADADLRWMQDREGPGGAGRTLRLVPREAWRRSVALSWSET